MQELLDTVRSYLGNTSLNIPSPKEAWSVADGQLRVVMQGDVLDPMLPTRTVLLVRASHWQAP